MAVLRKTRLAEHVVVLLEGMRVLWCFRIRRRFPWGLLPIPPRELIAWRLHTVYGPETIREVVRLVGWRVFAADVYKFLRWRREMRSLMGG
jgi:hypothetical protein